MDKLIITSGCSYTGAIGSGPPTPEVEGLPDWSYLSDEKALKYYRGWPDHLEEHLGIKVLNVGAPAAGNSYIHRATRWAIHDSLKKGYKPEDIHVFSQISSPDRFELLINKNDIDETSGFGCGCWVKFYDDEAETHKDMDDLDGFWYKHHAGHNPSNFIPKDTNNVWLKRSLMNIEERGPDNQWGPNDLIGLYYDKFYNEEYHVLLMMESILNTQYLCKSLNIQYNIFFGWQILTELPTMFQRLFGFMGGLFKDDGVYDGSISSFINKKMDLPNVNYMLDMVDWDRVWLNDEKGGGFREWCRGNLERKYWQYSKQDSHPSNEGHKQFAQQVIAKLYKESHEN